MINAIVDYLTPTTLAAILADLQTAEENSDTGDQVQLIRSSYEKLYRILSNNVGPDDASEMIEWAAKSL